MIILIIHIIFSYDQNISLILFVKMDSMSGCDIRLVINFPPKDSSLQYKKGAPLWNNFPCISTLIRAFYFYICWWILRSKYLHIDIYMSHTRITRQISKFKKIHLLNSLIFIPKLAKSPTVLKQKKLPMLYLLLLNPERMLSKKRNFK